MADEDEIGANIALSPDGQVTAVVSGKGVLASLRRAAAFAFPDRLARVRLTEAFVAGVEKKLVAGEFDELTEGERALAAHLMGERAGAFMRRAQIVERAERALPELEPRLLPTKPETGPAEETEPEKKPDPDWYRKFWADAELVSAEDVQELYARILAGEAIKPGTFSLRTLDVVRKLDGTTAQMFSIFVNHLIGGLTPGPRTAPGEHLRFADRHVKTLREAGLVDTTEHFLGEKFTGRYGNRTVTASHPTSAENPFSLRTQMVYIPTLAGYELSKVAHVVHDVPYFDVFVEWLRGLGFEVTVEPVAPRPTSGAESERH